MTLVLEAPAVQETSRNHAPKTDAQRSARVKVISSMQAMDVPLSKPSAALSSVVKNYVLAPERRVLPGLELLN